MQTQRPLLLSKPVGPKELLQSYDILLQPYANCYLWPVMRIGIIKEGKTPPDRRVPFSPAQCRHINQTFDEVEVVVQSSDIRCFTDKEYHKAGVTVADNVSDCAILMGVKEVPIEQLIPSKTYLFFSHTIKEQPYNRELLRQILRKNIRLVDYETLTDKNGFRLLGFGRYAGIVGCYNALRAWGVRHKSYKLKPAYKCYDRVEMESQLQDIMLPGAKILLTGGGRVARGAMEILNNIPITKVSRTDFIREVYEEAVYCQVDCDGYVQRKDGSAFDFADFFDHPEEYESTFNPLVQDADMYIACHFWDPDSPVFLSNADMLKPGFSIEVIADISCDINGPIASTIRASTIEDPLYGYDPERGEVAFDDENAVTVMAVDNLPCELPRNASEDFGKSLIERIIPCLAGDDLDEVMKRATITDNGQLTKGFSYLSDYVAG